MGSRRHNPRRAKSHFSYTLAETAELYDVHRQTVRHWLKSGLEPLDNRRPVLIHGAELNRFHSERRTARKRPCGPGQLYCLGCKEPRHPAGSVADYVPGSGTSGVLIGICPECESLMRQNVNAARLRTFQALLSVTTRPDAEPIGESS